MGGLPGNPHGHRALSLPGRVWIIPDCRDSSSDSVSSAFGTNGLQQTGTQQRAAGEAGNGAADHSNPWHRQGGGGPVAGGVGIVGAEDAGSVEGWQPEGRVEATPAVEARRVSGGRAGASSRSAERASTADSTSRSASRSAVLAGSQKPPRALREPGAMPLKVQRRRRKRKQRGRKRRLAGKQLELGFEQGELVLGEEAVCEYSVLVTSLEYEARAVAQLYRDRGDMENAVDELKNQPGLGRVRDAGSEAHADHGAHERAVLQLVVAVRVADLAGSAAGGADEPAEDAGRGGARDAARPAEEAAAEC